MYPLIPINSPLSLQEWGLLQLYNCHLTNANYLHLLYKQNNLWIYFLLWKHQLFVKLWSELHLPNFWEKPLQSTFIFSTPLLYPRVCSKHDCCLFTWVRYDDHTTAPHLHSCPDRENKGLKTRCTKQGSTAALHRQRDQILNLLKPYLLKRLWSCKAIKVNNSQKYQCPKNTLKVFQEWVSINTRKHKYRKETPYYKC